MSDKKIDFRDCFFEEGRLLFSVRDFNGLFNIDLDKEKADFLSFFGNADEVERHGTVIGTKKKVYFVPAMGRYLDIYERQPGRVISVQIYQDNDKWHCLSAYLLEDKIILLPFQSDNIIVYETQTGKVKEISRWEEKCVRKLSAEGKFFHGCGAVRGKRLYAVSMEHAGVMELDGRNLSIIWHHFGPSGQMAFSSMVDDGHFLWLAANKEMAIVRFEPENGKWEVFCDFPDGYLYPGKNGIPFCNLVDCNDRILAAALRSNMSLWINKKNGEITECRQLIQADINHMIREDREEYRLAKRIGQDTVLLVSCRDCGIVVFEPDSGRVTRSVINFTKENQYQILGEIEHASEAKGVGLIAEERFISLEVFLDYLNQEAKAGSDLETSVRERYEGVGAAIFASIKESMSDYIR